MSVKLFKVEMQDDSITIPSGYRFIFYKASRWLATVGGSSSSTSSSEPFVPGLWAFGGTGFYEKFNGFWGDQINGIAYKILEFPHNQQGLPGGASTPMWSKQCASSSSDMWYETRLVAFSSKTYDGGINWMLIGNDDEGDLNSDEMIENEIARGGTLTYAIACNTTISEDGYEVPYEQQTSEGPGLSERVVFNNCSGYTGNPPYFIWLTEPLTEPEPQPGDVFGVMYLYLAPNGTSNPRDNAKRISDYAIWPDYLLDRTPYKEKMIFNGGDKIFYVSQSGGSVDHCALIGMLLDSNGVPVPEATVRSLFNGYSLEFTTYDHIE